MHFVNVVHTRHLQNHQTIQVFKILPLLVVLYLKMLTWSIVNNLYLLKNEYFMVVKNWAPSFFQNHLSELARKPLVIVVQCYWPKFLNRWRRLRMMPLKIVTVWERCLCPKVCLVHMTFLKQYFPIVVRVVRVLNIHYVFIRLFCFDM